MYIVIRGSGVSSCILRCSQNAMVSEILPGSLTSTTLASRVHRTVLRQAAELTKADRYLGWIWNWGTRASTSARDPLLGLLSTTGPLGYALHFTNTVIAKSGVDSKDVEDASSNIPKQRLNESRIHPHDLPRRPGIMSRACFDLAERGWGVYATVIRG